jgi:hypothetical protein
MPPFKSHWLFYIILIGEIMVLIALSSIKANKSELNTILKQGDTLIIESRKTNNLLTKIVNDTIR